MKVRGVCHRRGNRGRGHSGSTRPEMRNTAGLFPVGAGPATWCPPRYSCWASTSIRSLPRGTGALAPASRPLIPLLVCTVFGDVFSPHAVLELWLRVGFCWDMPFSARQGHVCPSWSADSPPPSLPVWMINWMCRLWPSCWKWAVLPPPPSLPPQHPPSFLLGSWGESRHHQLYQLYASEFHLFGFRCSCSEMHT